MGQPFPCVQGMMMMLFLDSSTTSSLRSLPVGVDEIGAFWLPLGSLASEIITRRPRPLIPSRINPSTLPVLSPPCHHPIHHLKISNRTHACPGDPSSLLAEISVYDLIPWCVGSSAIDWP